MSKETFSIHTLGCKVNQAEAADVAQMLQAAGYEQVDFQNKADIYIINTCTVTAFADSKSRQFIRRAVKNNPQALIVATGCFVQAQKEAVQAIEGVDLIVGLSERANLLPLLELAKLQKQAQPILAVGDIAACHTFVDIPATGHGHDRTRVFMKIEDGCDNACSYCIIPAARGPVRSLPPDLVMEKAQAFLAEEESELVLTGIHLGAYGRDLPKEPTLASLLKQLVLTPNLIRLRLGSIEPDEISAELLAVMTALPKQICPHLHLPLQSGSDQTLKAMNRKYDTAFYANLLQKIRERMPNIAITTDVMVGFPGESKEDFATSWQFVSQQGFSRIHVFPYSKRPGTPAADFAGQIAKEEKSGRVQEMERLGTQLQQAFLEKNLGQTLFVCLEQEITSAAKNDWFGYSENYLPVKVQGERFCRGQLLPIKATAIAEQILLGEAL